MKAFDRQALLSPGHRLYSAARTIRRMSTTISANDSYSSRGRKVTWPMVPDDWTTCCYSRAKTETVQRKATAVRWAGNRRVRLPSTITGDPFAASPAGSRHAAAEADRVAKLVWQYAADRECETPEIRYRGGRPALLWLVKKDADLALAVVKLIRRGVRRAHVDNAIENDAPDAEVAMATMCDGGPETDEPLVDALHEIKPGVHTLCREAGGIAWPWSGRRTIRNGKRVWHGEPWRYNWTKLPEVKGSDIIMLGQLQFYCRPEARRGSEGGMLVRFGKERPAYRTDKPRGGKHSLRDDPSVYLGRRPTTPSPLTVDALTPTFPANYSTTKAVVARGATFMGGIMMGSGTAAAPALPIDEDRVPLTPALEEAAAGGTLADIGEVVRDKSRPAPARLDRIGKRALQAEARALVAANDNFSRRAAA